MKSPNQKEFLSFLKRTEIVKYFPEPIVLKSGKKSHWYFNWRKGFESVQCMDELSNLLLHFIEVQGLEFDQIIGVPESCMRIGFLCQFKRFIMENEDHPISTFRINEKEHGDPAHRSFLGDSRGRFILIEDVTTSGMSLFATVEKLLKMEGAQISAVVALTDRSGKTQEGDSIVGSLLLQKFGIPFLAILDFEDIVKEEAFFHE